MFVPAESMTLRAYACGAVAGQEVVLRKELKMEDSTGKPTGHVYAAGERWQVLTGNPKEPDVVWLRNPRGAYHTWDVASFREWFADEAEPLRAGDQSVKRQDAKTPRKKGGRGI